MDNIYIYTCNITQYPHQTGPQRPAVQQELSFKIFWQPGQDDEVSSSQPIDIYKIDPSTQKYILFMFGYTQIKL